MDGLEEEGSLKPTLIQRIYYKNLRYTLYLTACLICCCLSLAIIAGEVLIFQGMSIQPVFKKCLETMNYVTYLVDIVNMSYYFGHRSFI